MLGTTVNQEDLLQGIGALVWEAEPEDLHFSFVSKHAEKLLGWPAERFTASGSWGDHIHPADRERALRDCREVAGSGEDGQLEYRAVTADGRVVWIRDAVRLNRGPDGRVTLCGVMLDVTRRALSERETRFHSRLLDEVDAAVIATDLKGTVTHWNHHAEQLFGYARAEAVGRDIAELAIVDDEGFAARKMAALRA